MLYKEILVVLDDAPGCEERVNVALRLAAQHGAGVTGLMVEKGCRNPRLATTGLRSTNGNEQREFRTKACERVRERFERQAATAPVECAWRAGTGDPLDLVLRFSRHADLTVIGQENRANGGPGTSGALAERVVLASGRPLLVVPHLGTYPRIGQRVVIAWDASREAARAVIDALPLLKSARRVVAVSADVKARRNGRAPRNGLLETVASEIGGLLTRHGVATEVRRDSTRDVPLADRLLNRITDECADLLVMGAFGRPRVRQALFGGVTRRVMRSMTVPVFISH